MGTHNYTVSKTYLRVRMHQTVMYIFTSRLKSHHMLLSTLDGNENRHIGDLVEFTRPFSRKVAYSRHGVSQLFYIEIKSYIYYKITEYSRLQLSHIELTSENWIPRTTWLYLSTSESSIG
jgi:hypothetical protein